MVGCTDFRPGGSILSPGIEQHVLTVVVDVLPNAPDGTAIPVRLGKYGDPAQECIFVSPEATTQPAKTVDGAVLVGSSPVPEVREAAAEVVESGVRLHWENGGDYDAVRIERDGELLPAPGPGSTSYLDAGIEPGFHYYSIVARKGERDSFPVGVGVRFRVDERGRSVSGDRSR